MELLLPRDYTQPVTPRLWVVGDDIRSVVERGGGTGPEQQVAGSIRRVSRFRVAVPACDQLCQPRLDAVGDPYASVKLRLCGCIAMVWSWRGPG